MIAGGAFGRGQRSGRGGRVTTGELPPQVSGLRLGMVFVGAVLGLSFAAAIGLPVNITIGTVGLGLVYLVMQPALLATCLSAWTVSHAALAAFVALALASLGLSLGRVAALPIEYFLHSIALLVFCPVVFLFGAVVTKHATAEGLARLFHLALGSVVAFVSVIYLAPDLLSDNEIARGSYYQYVGDCLAVVALAHLCTRRAGMSMLAVIGVIPVLVMVGSRASLVAFVAAMSVSSLMPVMLASSLLLVLGWPWIEDLLATVAPDMFEISRVATTLAATALEGREDASLLERQGFQAAAFESIREHPLFGRFGYDYFANGFAGGFSHSVADVWAQYGMPAFIAFATAVLAVPILALMTSAARGSFLRAIVVIGPLLVFLSMEFLLFRHPESVVLFFGAGALVGLANRTNAAPVPRRYGRTQRR